MRNFPYVCKDCGKVFFVKGGGNAGTNVALGNAAYTNFGIGGNIIKDGSVIEGQTEDDNLFTYGAIVSSLMCPFCKSKNVEAGKATDSIRALLAQKDIPADSSIYKILDIFSHLVINWSYKTPDRTEELSAVVTEQVLNAAPYGAYNTLDSIVEGRKAFNHHLLVRQERDGILNYYVIGRRKGILFTVTVDGDDIRFEFEDGIQHTPAEINNSMAKKLDGIWKKYFNDYSCYFEIA